MTIHELIDEAREKSPEFEQKWVYWTQKRNKAPTIEWLMPLLEDALGRSYVRQAAENYVKSKQEEQAKTEALAESILSEEP